MSNRTHRYCVGIDPDVEASGVAFWDVPEKKLVSVGNLSFWELIEKLESVSEGVSLVVEAGWLIKKSQWRGGHNKGVSEKIAKNVGRNHQIGLLIVEYCKRRGIPCSIVKPRGKLKADVFKNITKWPNRTNQDSRDAAMLVFGM